MNGRSVDDSSSFQQFLHVPQPLFFWIYHQYNFLAILYNLKVVVYVLISQHPHLLKNYSLLLLHQPTVFLVEYNPMIDQ